MAWNQSTGPTKVEPKKPSALRGVVAGLVVVALAAACVAVFMGKGEKPVDKAAKERGRIKEVKPAKAATNAPTAEVREKAPKALSLKERSAIARHERNVKNGIRDFVPPAYTSVVSNARHETTLFSNEAESWLAVLLTLEPGEGIIGDPEELFGPRFRKQLEASVVSKIEDGPDDTAEDKEMKQMVRDAKKEIFERIRSGEDGCQIFKETFKEIQQLGLYKEELEGEVRKAIKDGKYSDDDVKDLLDAANVMLKDRGVEGIKMPGMFKSRMRILSKQLDKKGGQK